MYPGRAESAGDGVADRGDVAPGGTVEGYLVSGKNFTGQTGGQCGGDAHMAVFRQNIDADLPHGVTVCAAGGQSDESVSVIGPDTQYIQFLAGGAKGV